MTKRRKYTTGELDNIVLPNFDLDFSFLDNFVFPEPDWVLPDWDNIVFPEWGELFEASTVDA